jgi:hypothetical protein
MPGSGNRNLQWASANDGGIIEIAAVRLVDHIAQNARLLAEPKDLHMQFWRVCRANDQENSIKIGRQKRARVPNNFARVGSSANARCSLRRHYMNGGAAANETLHLAFAYRPAADDKALASCQLQKQGK